MMQAHWRSGNLLVHRTRKRASLVRKKQGRRLLPNAVNERLKDGSVLSSEMEL
jgi:hypothetical protein